MPARHGESAGGTTGRLSRGTLITLEGGEGAGKSTLCSALRERLEREGYRPIATQEPAGTELGRHVKAFFEEQARLGGIDPAAELFLFEAARAQHVREVIRPALSGGHIVLCDRFTDSTVAYQGYGRGLSLDQIEVCNQLATGGLTPDLTLLLDLPPEGGLARARREAGRKDDSIGGESLEFHRRVRKGFLEPAVKDPARVKVLKADKAPQAVADEAWAWVRPLLHKPA